MSKPVSPGPQSISLTVEASQEGPPKRSKLVAFLAALACIGCCALPLLIPL